MATLHPKVGAPSPRTDTFQILICIYDGAQLAEHLWGQSMAVPIFHSLLRSGKDSRVSSLGISPKYVKRQGLEESRISVALQDQPSVRGLFY